MNKTQYLIIQYHAVMILLGYWLTHSIVVLSVGESSRIASIAYDMVQFIVSIYVLWTCRRDIVIERSCPVFFFLLILMLLYSIRILVDMSTGPFLGQIPNTWFINDFLFIVVGVFVSIWALITSRKWINIQFVIRLVFWVGLITILAIVFNKYWLGTLNSYEEERMAGGQGLGTLALVKIGVIESIAGIHLLLNEKKSIVLWLIYVVGIVLGGWLALASGSRGGVAGLVVALGFYWVCSSRKNIFMIVLAVLGVAAVIIYIEPILNWVSNYFPIFGKRMLRTILENDQSYRSELRAAAIQKIIEHPFWGYSYRLTPTPTGFVPHNGILEVFLALGIPVGVLFFVKGYCQVLLMSIKLSTKRKYFFPSVFSVFVLVSSLSSSSLTNAMFDFAICFLVISYQYDLNNQPYAH